MQRVQDWVWILVFNCTFNTIGVISWRSVLLVEETGVSSGLYVLLFVSVYAFIYKHMES